jgi:hypothetical protein
MSDEQESVGMRRLEVVFKRDEWEDLEYLRYVGKLGSISETVRACVRLWAHESRKALSSKGNDP